MIKLGIGILGMTVGGLIRQREIDGLKAQARVLKRENTQYRSEAEEVERIYQYKNKELKQRVKLYNEINNNQVETIEQQRQEIEKHLKANKVLEKALRGAYESEDYLEKELEKAQDSILQLKESEQELSREISHYKNIEIPFTEDLDTTIPRHILDERGLLNETDNN